MAIEIKEAFELWVKRARTDIDLQYIPSMDNYVDLETDWLYLAYKQGRLDQKVAAKPVRRTKAAAK